MAADGEAASSMLPTIHTGKAANGVKVQLPSQVTGVLLADAQVRVHGSKCVLVNGARDVKKQHHG